MHDGLLYPTLTEMDDQIEKQQMDGGNEDETPSHSDIILEPEGEGKRREQDDGDEKETEYDCQGGGRNQARYLVNHIKFDVFSL